MSQQPPPPPWPDQGGQPPAPPQWPQAAPPPPPPGQQPQWPQQPDQPPQPQAPPPPAPPAGGDDAGQPDDVVERALFHATEATRTYPCRACGGELEFSVSDQNLVCPHCGNEQEIERSAAGSVQTNDYRQAVAALRSGAIGGQGPQLQGEHEVVCQNCGGHTTFSGTLTATRCPYCATPIQRDDVHGAPTRLAVDGVMPFQVDERAANEAVQSWVKKRWFAPNEFKKYSQAGSFNSVYMAYFSYDAETSTQYRGERGDEYQVTVGSGDNKRTVTRTRWRDASGQVSNDFEDLMVHANEGLNRGHVKALEPWPLANLQSYTPEYVAGHLCRTYDHDVEQSFGEAQQTIDRTVEKSIKRDIGGDKQRIHAKDTNYRSLDYKHLLMPLWLLAVMFEGKAYQVLVNGVTGEVKGDRPWSKVKLALAILAAIVVIVTVVMLIVVFGDDGGTSSGTRNRSGRGFGSGR